MWIDAEILLGGALNSLRVDSCNIDLNLEMNFHQLFFHYFKVTVNCLNVCFLAQKEVQNDAFPLYQKSVESCFSSFGEKTK